MKCIALGLFTKIQLSTLMTVRLISVQKNTLIVCIFITVKILLRNVIAAKWPSGMNAGLMIGQSGVRPRLAVAVAH